jgi:NAD(P)-dependent dehydrogenase (short-subunit alcohol dehydrogenase family)
LIRFEERVVLVTGAGRGLGAAYARKFAERGASVVVHDAGVGRGGEGGDPAVADAVVEEIRASGGTAVASYENLASKEACVSLVESTVAALGRLDVLVNNAGLVVYEEIEESDRSWEVLRRVHVDAPFHLSRAAFPVMRSQRYGRLIFTTSGIAMSADETRPGLAAYALGKMAQFGLMVVLAVEGREHGILSNAISPVAATRVYTRRAEPGRARAGAGRPRRALPGRRAVRCHRHCALGCGRAFLRPGVGPTGRQHRFRQGARRAGATGGAMV